MTCIAKAAYDGDIVSRLRNWRGLHLAHGGDLFEEAADEIERLRLAIRRLADQDENERSVASDGSLVGEPVAWAALRDDGDIAWIGYTPEGAADGACGRRIVPLYRSPTLTDAEREAIAGAIESEHGRGAWQWADALHGLLERLK